MRKMMMTLAATLCCVMTITVFTACGGGDDDSNTQPSDPTKVVAYQVDYSLEFPQELPLSKDEVQGNMYLLCDKIEVGYFDENGQEQREVVNNGKWTKSITYQKTLNGYLKLYFTKPANIDVESLPHDYYGNIITDLSPTFFLKGIMKIYSNGTKVEEEKGDVRPNIPGLITLEKDKLPQYFEETFKSEIEIMTIKLNI